MYLKDFVVFKWRYSFYNSEYVANESWQDVFSDDEGIPVVGWLPKTIPDPLPFFAALCGRAADIGVSIVFFPLALTAAILFEELADRANAMKEMPSSNNLPMALKDWRRHYNLICEFVEKISNCFGPMLLLQICLGFALPIFDFNKILLSKGQLPRHYFQFGHNIIRFLVILVPSYLITQKVRSNASSFLYQFILYF